MAAPLKIQGDKKPGDTFQMGIEGDTGIASSDVGNDLPALLSDPTKAAAMAYLGQDMDAARSAWKIDYTGYGVVGKCVRRYAACWHPEEKCVPLAPSIQSSGKSRLVHTKPLVHVPSCDNKDDATYHLDCTKAYGNLLKPKLKLLEKSGKFLLLCVDDAAELSSLIFARFRRMLKTIVKISKDSTASAAEPALAVAAAELLHCNGDAYLCEFISKLIEVCVDGLVLEGVCGEMAIRLVMLLAMHECTKSQKYIKPVRLQEYLETLFGKVAMEELKQCCGDFSSNMVFFNCFIATMSMPSVKQYRDYYKRASAIICRKNESILGLIIPANQEPCQAFKFE
ncbi:hypothetical protein SELMODRAFT_428769 [Selaginella moellendorffii]|uniref:Uncharacterized protein n=1 Tax=Selaginella moellendorffii TaxID=88036 RepID=D8T3X8_SELML|nr:hypothetical protein SELMODRAFT_428769 [Selaginella moellendorffii]